jgi:N6-L-threonylcarbamoyladenine synthase
MIGVAGYYEYRKGVRSGLDLNAVPNLKLGDRTHVCCPEPGDSPL